MNRDYESTERLHTATYPLSRLLLWIIQNQFGNHESIYNIFVNMMKMAGWWFNKSQCVDADHAVPGGT